VVDPPETDFLAPLSTLNSPQLQLPQLRATSPASEIRQVTLLFGRPSVDSEQLSRGASARSSRSAGTRLQRTLLSPNSW
jgi:hypothetical protein